MKQKILSLIIIAIFGFAAKAQTIVDSGDGWSLDSEGLLTITKNLSFTLPSDIPWNESRKSVKSVEFGESVTNIGNRVLYNCSNLKSVTIPEGVTSIGTSAFSGCTNLTSIEIPSSITSIGNYAFERCNVIRRLHIGSIESWCRIKFGDKVFNLASTDVKLYDKNGEVKELVIPEDVTKINPYAFYGCKYITKITIPEGVAEIGNYAFRGCSALTSIEIPSSVTRIGWNAFSDCSGLASMIIPEGVESIGSEAFSGCSGLTGNLKIPDGITEIYDDTFYGCSGLTSVEIPSSVTIIDSEAFSGCSGLTSVTIPEGVTEIYWHAFSDCSGLKNVEISSSVSYIDDGIFSGCSSLESIVVDEENTKYESRGNSIIEKSTNTLVSGCKNTKIPDDVESISSEAFSGCSGLTSIEIPSSVTRIGSYAFDSCSSLESIVVAEGNAKYDSRDNCNAIIEKSTNTLVLGCKNTIIPNDVESIGRNAFYGCSGLTGDLTIAESVTSIGDYAFYDCSGLTSVVIPEGVESIGSGAFSGCSGLTGNLKIPDGITEIYDDTFYGCSGLTSVTIPEGVTGIGDYAFYGCSGLTSIEIPSSVTSIGWQAFSKCSGLESIVVAEGNANYDSRDNCNAIIEKSTNALILGSNNTEIPEGVESIGSGAFSGCSGLKKITIPSSVTSIDVEVFLNCSSLESIVVAEENAKYDSRYNCNAIIEKSTKTLVLGCKNTIIPNEVESIGQNAFYGRSNMTSIEIPSSVTSIGAKAFYGCSNLTSVSIGSVGYSAVDSKFDTFYGCDNLKYVFIYQERVVDNLTEFFPTYETVEKFFVPDNLLESEDGYRDTYNNVGSDKFVGFTYLEKEGIGDEVEKTFALALDKESCNFIAWAVNNGEQVRRDEEISIALTKDFDLDAENVTWQTLGTTEHPFKGILEGNYLSVKGNHRANATQPKSIFGYIGEGAEIRNVVFSDFIVDATSAGVTDGGKTYYGLVARENKGLIRNSIFEGRMEIDADADDIENAEACLVIDNEEGGELDHVIGYFEGLDGEVTGNKTSIIVIQNIGHGRTRGHSKKSASNGKTKSKGNSMLSAEVPDDINLNYRLFTDEEFAGAEPAYWLNFDGEGYSGTFNGEWTQGTKHPVLAKGEHGATVGVKYNVVNRDESVLGPSPVFFATSKSSLEVEYSEKPLSIEVNGTEINASQIGDMKAKFSLASVDTDKGNVNVVLKYEKQSTPTAVDDIDAAGNQKTIKTVENGRVVIIRDGKKYDLAGRVLSDKF
ncbi:MAG: leucine-rich repeat domain-containing protein [Bacteroidales bacterium]|nr:leucine-rich repeat domain-containing protein [Bacteroidales bacterium]